MATVTFQSVAKRFGSVDAVAALDLEVADGEFVVFVGPSGSGKTTALRMLAGLESITAGEILIGGRVVNDLRPQARNIAMVFQDYALYPQMTVAANLAFGLKIRKLAANDIRERVRDMAAILEIEGLLDRKPAQLSGGQRQRVALGRALVRNPSVFLMDEPLSNLDAKLRVQTRGEIARLQKRLEVTTIYVTHDQVEAMTMGQRIVVMNGGRVEQIGAPAHVYANPANRFVAGFIGSPPMSFADAVVQDGLLSIFGVRVPAPGLPSGPVVVGIRSEHARLWRSEHVLAGPITGAVTDVEALGRETFIGVEVDGTRVVLGSDGSEAASLGSVVSFGLVGSKLHFFDPGTGTAISRRAVERSTHAVGAHLA